MFNINTPWQFQSLENYQKFYQTRESPPGEREPIQPDNDQANVCADRGAVDVNGALPIDSVSVEGAPPADSASMGNISIHNSPGSISIHNSPDHFLVDKAPKAENSKELCVKHVKDKHLALINSPGVGKLKNMVSFRPALWLGQSSSSHSQPVWTHQEETILNNWKNQAIGAEKRAKAVNILTEFKKKGKNKLDLSNLSLKNLPPVVCRMNIKELDISGNDLRSLDPKIEQITGLVSLNISENSLTSLPEELGELHELKRIDLSNNKLMSLPESFEFLAHLETLKLDYNRFEHLPVEIVDLNKLSTLSISHNHLEQVPDILNKMQGLLHLDMSHNQISNVSRLLDSLLEKLITFNLSNNEIFELPFRRMPKVLKTLDLSNNHIFTLPKTFGAIMWAEKGRLKTTSRNSGNMRIIINNTNLVAGLHEEGRLELKDDNYAHELPTALRPPPRGGSMYDSDFSDIDPADWGVGPLPSGGVEGFSVVQKPVFDEFGDKISPVRPPRNREQEIINLINRVQRWRDGDG